MEGREGGWEGGWEGGIYFSPPLRIRYIWREVARVGKEYIGRGRELKEKIEGGREGRTNRKG